jgi:hypothetical protein
MWKNNSLVLHAAPLLLQQEKEMEDEALMHSETGSTSE